MSTKLQPRLIKSRGILFRLILLLLMVFIPALLMEAYIYYDRFQTERSQELRSNLELARAVSRGFEGFVRDILHQEHLIGVAMTSGELTSPQSITRLLTPPESYGAVREFSWVSPEGVFLYSSNPAMIGANNSDRAYFREVGVGCEWTVGELVLARTSGKPVFGISRGIRDEKGRLLGVVVATILPERLDEVLSVERSEGGGHALVDHRGMLVYRYPAIELTWEERNWIKDYPEYGEVLKGREIATTVYAPYEGKHRLVGFAPVPSIGWAATAGRTEEIAMEAAAGALRFHAILFLGVMIVAFGTALLLSRKVAAPIRKIRDHSRALGKGESEGPVMAEGPSELQDLAHAFNEMVERVRTREEALRESEERLRVTINSIGDAVLATDTAARITFVNPAASKLTGWAPEEALDQPIERVFRIVDERTNGPMDDPVRCVLREGVELDLANHVALLCRDGGTVPIEDSAAPIKDKHGRVIGAILVFHDVSERREAQETLTKLNQELERRVSELQTIFDTAPIGLAIADDPEGLHIRGNRVNEELVGAPPRGELSKRGPGPASYRVLHHGRELAVDELPMQRAVRGEIVSGQVVDLIRPDGGAVILYCNATPLFDEEGRPRGAVGAFLDFTKIKRTEEELQQALRDAEAGNRTLETLMEYVPEGIAIAEAPDLKIRMVSRHGLELLGDTRDGQSVGEVADSWNVYHQDGKTPMTTQDLPLAKAIQNGEIVKNAELIKVNTKGEQLALLCNAAPIRGSGGEILGGIIAWRDITEMRAVQHALLESQKDLNRAQAVGRIGSWRLNVPRNELVWSEENHRIFGIPMGSSMTYETFLECVHPEDRDYVHERWSAALEGELYDIRHRIRVGDTVKWVRERAELEVDQEGSLLGGFGTTQDITELVQAEEGLRESEARFRLLSGTAAQLLAAEDPRRIVSDLADKVMAHLDCHAFFNFVVDDQAGKLHLNAYAGIPEEQVKEIEWLDCGVAVCGCVARDKVRIVAEDICSASEPCAEKVKSFGINAYACHPLIATGKVIGTISFGTRSRSGFSAQDLELMKTVADQVAMAMERMQLTEELQKSKDELEMRVMERTAQLAEANRSLEAEIGERVRAEKSLGEKHEQLRQSEQLLRTILNALPVGVFITDEAGTIVMANPAGGKIWEGARYVALDQYAQYKGWWSDTGKPIAAQDWALARALVQGETSINEVVDIECFDGTRKTILNSALPIHNDQGGIVRAIVVIQDITELREAEKALRRSEEGLHRQVVLLQRIVDGITDPLIMLDEAGMVKMVNKAALDYYGGVQAADVLGKPCFEGLRGRETVCPDCGVPFLSADRQPVTFERKGLNDAKRVESVTIYPVLIEPGYRDAIIVKISDVTQQRLLERQMLHNEKLASLGLLISGIAHEINNPNSFIHFNLPILKSYLLELMPILDEYAGRYPEYEVFHMPYTEFREDIFKLIGNMEHGSQRINKIVTLLKSFARKGDSSDLQMTKVKDAVDKAIAICHAEIRHKVKQFGVEVSEGIPPMPSNPEALEQIVLNLLINAVHACDKPDSWIKLKVDFEHPGGDVLVMEVSDNGTGMEAAVVEKIFDPFFTTKSDKLGTGLGLYICHNLVQSLGGSIEVESTPGKGSTFRVVIPWAKHA